MTGVVAFVGDVHLEPDDPVLDDFIRFLETLADEVPRIVLLGDLFTLWIGRPELQGPHHRAVTDALGRLRARGTVVRYVEGNRDYRIGPCFAGSALDDATDLGTRERAGPAHILAVHGDLANAADRQYRAWRRVSRSAAAWALFNLVPAVWRRRLSERLEQRMRGTNRDFKGAFPDDAVRRYAERWLADGFDHVVLGHFHVERTLVGDHGTIHVLPEWKGSRRHLLATDDGRVAMVASGPARRR